MPLSVIVLTAESRYDYLDNFSGRARLRQKDIDERL